MFLSSLQHCISMNYPRHALVSLFALILLLFYSTVFADQAVEGVTVKRGDIKQTIQFIGTIKAQQSTTLIVKSKGVLDILVDAGTVLKKGDLIAKIENPDVEKNYKLSEEAEQIAKSQYERTNQLLDKGVSSKMAVEDKRNAWIGAQRKLSDAKISLEQIYIYAPFEGIAGIFKIREGSQVQDGESLVSFFDPSSLIVVFDVPMSIVNELHDKPSVIINHHEYELTHIQKMLDEDTHMCPAYVKIKCNDCIVGATVNVNLVQKALKSVIIIPSQAIFFRNGSPHLYIAKEGRAVLTAIKTGIQENELVEVTSGLSEGDIVITGGNSLIRSNSKVNVTLRDYP